jgi:hypothetical protein
MNLKGINPISQVLFFCIFSYLAVNLLPLNCLADEVPEVNINITPPLIVLNAQGHSEDIQAIINMAMGGNYHITDFSIKLSFEDLNVGEAIFLRYCYVDSNFLASFSREDLLNNPLVISLAGQTVLAKVEGWIELADQNETQFVYREFFGYDSVEIIAPDPCWGDFDNDGDVDGGNLVELINGTGISPMQMEIFSDEFGRQDCMVTGGDV